MLLDWQTRLA